MSPVYLGSAATAFSNLWSYSSLLLGGGGGNNDIRPSSMSERTTSEGRGKRPASITATVAVSQSKSMNYNDHTSETTIANSKHSSTTTATPFIMDPWHLHYLNSRFEELGLRLFEWEDELDDNTPTSTAAQLEEFDVNQPATAKGILLTGAHRSQSTQSGRHESNDSAAIVSLRRVAGRRPRAPSITSTRSNQSVTSAAMSFFANLSRWSGAGSGMSESYTTTVDEDVQFIYQCLRKLVSVRIGPFGKRRILDADDCLDKPEGIRVSLGAFTSIRRIEIIKLSPLAFTGWMRLQAQLEYVGCRGKLERVEDLLLETLRLEMHRRETMLLEAKANNGSCPQCARMSTITEVDEDFQTVYKCETCINATSTAASSSYDPKNTQTSKSLSAGEKGLQSSFTLSPTEVWPKLAVLDLASNSFTDIPGRPFVYAWRCTELNLSHNLLNTWPEALADLTQLRILDLSYNMIESLSGATGTLATLTTLSLRANRLRNLAGLEHLSMLEQLDVRDNRIEDPAEIGRLVGLPLLRSIRVEGNALTRVVSDQKVNNATN
jgi:hypothetical protein